MGKQVLFLLGVIACWICLVASHGRLWEPPGRSTAWRRGFSTPVNYNDMQLWCGGFQHQVRQGYRCGLCGDPFDGVRENETGGRFATGTITRTYTQGQRITIQVDLTAAHRGWFEFKICSRSNAQTRETQGCFDANVLSLANGSGTKLYVDGSRMYSIDVNLPGHLSCEFCVLQWRYHAGNNWGTDPNGQSGMGRGHQEEFYGCADIRITRSGGGSPPNQAPVAVRPQQPPAQMRPQPQPQAPAQNRGGCRAIGAYAAVPNHHQWCVDNCSRGHCPPTHCQC